MNTQVDPNEQIEYDGTPMAIRDVPDAFTRAMLGYGHHPAEIRTRERWPGFTTYTPGACLVADQPGVWINDGQNLVCTGCGLEGT